MPYQIPLPNGWRLSRTTGISEDGYTICGVGLDPNGKVQGWVAVLPPILHPPKIDAIPLQRAEFGKPFSLEIKGNFLSGDTFSSEHLPDGFQIDSATGRIT